MNIRLHANATTTPKIRRFIRESDRPIAQLAKELHVSEDTIRRWKRRDRVADGSHTPHRACRRPSPLLPLDDLLVVTREFIHPEASRSALDRCLRRHGVANLKALLPRRKAPRRR